MIAKVSSFAHTHSHDVDTGHEHSGDEGNEVFEIDAERLATVTDVDRLRRMFVEASDAEEQSLVACRTLDVDVRAGAWMVIEFLKIDPPLLFRLTVLDKLSEVTGQEMPYDIERSFAAPHNQEAVEELRHALGLAEP